MVGWRFQEVKIFINNIAPGKAEIVKNYAGKIPIFDVDVEGGLQIKKKFGENLLAVFVRPPSVEELHNRLKERNSETPESFKIRIAKSEHELSYAFRFDKVIVNDNLKFALKEAQILVNDFLEVNP